MRTSYTRGAGTPVRLDDRRHEVLDDRARDPVPAAARRTAPGIASSSGSRPAAMSRAMELPSVSWARSRSAIAWAAVHPPLRPRDGRRLLDRALELEPQLGRRADRPEEHVERARRARERIEPTSFDDITWASDASTRVGTAPRRGRPRRPRPTARPTIVARHVDEQERARVHRDPGLGPVGLDADRPGEHPGRLAGRGRKRARSTARWSSPLSSGSTIGGSTATRSNASGRPAAFVATMSRSTGSCSRVATAGWATKSPRGRCARSAALGDEAAVHSRGDDRRRRARAIEGRGENAADATRPEDADAQAVAHAGPPTGR